MSTADSTIELLPQEHGEVSVLTERSPNYEALPPHGVQSLPVKTHPRAVRSFLAKTLVFALLGILALGLATTVGLAAGGVTADGVSTFLHDALTTLVPLVSAVVGFYFGSAESRERGNSEGDSKD